MADLPSRLLRRSFHLYWRFSRGMTLGARGLVRDADGRVFLIRHGYSPGWHLPGGGVEPGETFAEALTRELLEEGNIRIAGAPRLHGIFFNGAVSRRDHVAVFLVERFEQPSMPVPGREIVAHGWFAPDALPPDTTEGTRRRIAEIAGGLPASPHW